jgi:hypothetical protein
MLVGAALGWLLGSTLDSGVDVTTLVGAAAGTSLAFLQSKRFAPRALPMASRWVVATTVPSAIPTAESTADPHNS